jgi:hypothetical protein
MPVETGRPVALVSVRDEGVPKFGVVSVGESANTAAPVPVSSLIAVAICEDVAVSVLLPRLIVLLVSVWVVSSPTTVTVDGTDVRYLRRLVSCQMSPITGDVGAEPGGTFKEASVVEEAGKVGLPVKVGDVANTAAPEPVSSLRAVDI